MAVAALSAAGFAAGVWVNALVEPWSWTRRGPELVVVLTAVVSAVVARRAPLPAALVLLAVVFLEIHTSWFVYGIIGASTVLAPTMVAASGFLLGGVGAYAAAALSIALILAAALLEGGSPGLPLLEVEQLFYVGTANVAVALITAKGLEVFRETAERAEASRRATADLIRHAPDGIVTLDRQGRILTANPTAGLLLRQTPGVLEGMRLDALPVRLQRADGSGTLRLDEGDGTPVEIVATSPDGDIRHMELAARSFPGRSGARQLLVVLRDVTERVEAAEREARLEARVRETQRLSAVAQLAGGLAHDFNNIFTVIRGAAELAAMEAGEDPDGVRESAETILEAQGRGAALIRQLLSYARPEDEAPETFEVAGEVRQLRHILEGLVGDRVSLALQLDADGPVAMGRQRFRQMVFNLLNNARDAMPEGGVATVALDAAPGHGEGEWLRLTVRDTGEGMEPATVARMFEPFFTTRRYPEYSGLGLATVKGIVDSAGGRTQVNSTPGEGTTVQVLLPLAAEGS